MEIRFQNSPQETASMHTEELRKKFLCDSLLQDDQVKLIYTLYDRVIAGGAKPLRAMLELPAEAELRAAYFLGRREMGIINVGGPGQVKADGKDFALNKLDCLYIGKGVKEVSFTSISATEPAMFYFLSAPAHQSYPSELLKKEQAAVTSLGDQKTANQRTVYKYIHPAGIKSCQLVMGLTVLAEGSVWNTMPAHTHTRRMEAYFYFDLAAEHRIMILWVSQPRQDIWLLPITRLFYFLPGRSIRDAVPVTIHLFGEWPVKIMTILIWIRHRLPSFADTIICACTRQYFQFH